MDHDACPTHHRLLATNMMSGDVLPAMRWSTVALSSIAFGGGRVVTFGWCSTPARDEKPESVTPMVLPASIAAPRGVGPSPKKNGRGTSPQMTDVGHELRWARK